MTTNHSHLARSLWQVALLGCVLAVALSTAAEARRSGAEVRVGPGPDFTAVTGQKLNVNVSGRFPKRSRIGGRVWLRYDDAPIAKCARSYRRGRGRGVRLTVSGSGAGEFLASGRHTFRKPGRVRFCVWLSKSPRARTKPVTQDVRFSRSLSGAAFTPSGSFWRAENPNLTSLNWGAASTEPFTSVMTTTSRPVDGKPGCPDPRTDASEANRRLASSGLYETWGFGPVGTGSDQDPGPCVKDQHWQLAFGTTPYSFDYTHDERVSGALPVKQAGDCLLGSGRFMNVAEAEAYTSLVGCVPGRVIEREIQPNRFGTPHQGEVAQFERFGAPVTLAPPGTPIDIVVRR